MTRRAAPPPPPPRAAAPAAQRRPPPTYLVVLGSMVLLWLVACGLVWLWVALARETVALPPTPVVGMLVVTEPVFDTPTPEPTLLLVPPTAEITATIPAGPAGQIVIGNEVRVVGTGSDGLRLRQRPGLAAEVNYLGIDFEIFTVQDGPIEADGYVWWFLVAPDDNTRNGWAVQNFLEITGP